MKPTPTPKIHSIEHGEIIYHPDLQVIYSTMGLAADLAPKALTIYNGCKYACKYCCVTTITKQSKEKFNTRISPRKDLIPKLIADCKRMKAAGDTRPVLLSYLSDPCPPEESRYQLTRKVLEVFHEYDIHYKLLTKSASKELFCVMMLRPDLCEYGASLVFDKDTDSKAWEPNAALTSERIDALWSAHKNGLSTFAVLEPQYDFENGRDLIYRIFMFIGKVYIGKMSYHPHEHDINWVEFADKMCTFCDIMGVRYVLKRNLKNLIASESKI